MFFFGIFFPSSGSSAPSWSRRGRRPRDERTRVDGRDEPMTDRSLDELGPVDYIVVEFPAGASNFTGEMAKELLRLVDAGIIA